MDLNILNYFNLFYSLISLGRQSNPRQIPGELRRIQHSSRLGFQEGKAMLQAASALTRHALKSIKKTGAQQDVMERNVPCAMRCIFVYCILMCTPYIRIYIYISNNVIPERCMKTPTLRDCNRDLFSGGVSSAKQLRNRPEVSVD